MAWNIGFGKEKEDFSVNVKTVGDMIKQLQKLPKTLPVRTGGGESVDLVIFNRAEKSIHLGFEEGGEWT